ncbi:MAG: CDC27 family protein [Bacteroidia bacterium]|nr:CDC27 family protein [Bacteroidia bacterium]
MSTSPNNRHCLSLGEMEEYVKGSLSQGAAHAVEKHLLHCELCNDAVEGFRQHPFTAADLPPEPQPKNIIRWKVLSSAAAAAAIVAGIFLFQNDSKENLISEKADRQTKRADSSAGTLTAAPEQSRNKMLNALVEKDKEVGSLIREPVKKMEVQPDFYTAKDTSFWVMPQQKVSPLNNPAAPENGLVSPKDNLKDTFLFDLKVTHYAYYYVSGEEVPDQIRSTEARFENEQEKDLRKKEGKDLEWVTTEDVIRKAMENFSEGNYASALKLYNVLISYEPNDVNALFYASVCYKNLNRAADAVSYLERVTGSIHTSFAEEAEWELAQCYVQMKEFKKAEEQLEKIWQKKGFYSERALPMLRKVRLKNKKQ